MQETGVVGLIPRLRRSPEEENSKPLQCSCLEKPMDGGAWWTTVHGTAKSWTRLSAYAHITLTNNVHYLQKEKKTFHTCEEGTAHPVFPLSVSSLLLRSLLTPVPPWDMFCPLAS